MKLILNKINTIFVPYTAKDMENNTIIYSVRTYLRGRRKVYDKYDECIAEIEYKREPFKMGYYNIYYNDKVEPAYRIGSGEQIQLFDNWIQNFKPSIYNWKIKGEEKFCGLNYYHNYNIEDENGSVLAMHNVEKLENYKLKKFILNIYDEEHLLELFIFNYVFETDMRRRLKMMLNANIGRKKYLWKCEICGDGAKNVRKIMV